jgi:hypothetical protein
MALYSGKKFLVAMEYMSIFFWVFGVTGIMLFHEGIYLPIIASAIVIAVSPIYLFRQYQQSRLGPLTMLLFVGYVLPFIHIFPYIWFDFETEAPLILWGLAVTPYSTDKVIIELMSMIGAVGAAGFVAGASLLKGKIFLDSSSAVMTRTSTPGKTLSMPVFIAWVTIALILSWISAPADTIFTAAYTESESIHKNLNFSSAWMISYAFLLFALADSLFEVAPKIGKLKRKIVLIALLFIVIWFQLLRGDRETLTCVIGALLMYYLWDKGLHGSVKHRLKWNWPIILLLLFIIQITSYFVGTMRHSLIGVDSISGLLNVFSSLVEDNAIRFDNLIHGTWSGVLLSPLSVAGDYINGILTLKYGQTYLDLLSSIIPGFLADWIGFARPIDAFQGPAWEMTYGLGGTHAVVVPFIDFRMAGVFMIVTLWSFAFAKIERYSIKRLKVSNLALLGIIAMAVPHWMWYGEKYIMNALIIWFILSIFYRMRLFHSAKKPLRIDFQPSKASS